MLKPTCKVVMTKGFKKGVLKTLDAAFGGPNKVKVGFPAGKTEPDIVKRAILNEFGTRGGRSGGGWGGPIPERPFLRNSMRINRGKYQSAMAAAAREILRGAIAGSDARALKRRALDTIGIMAQGDIQAEITALRSPPNSPVTIKLKGSSNPLIDTGELRGRVTWQIED